MESKAHQSALVAWCVAIAKMMLITMREPPSKMWNFASWIYDN